MDEENEERRRDELETLQAIFGEGTVHWHAVQSLTVCTCTVNTKLTTPIVVRHRKRRKSGTTIVEETHVDEDDAEETLVHYLPSLVLKVELPPGYPGSVSSSPHPQLSCTWLPPPLITRVVGHLLHIWTHTEAEILFQWVQFLESELVQFLEIDLIDVNSIALSKARTKVRDGPRTPRDLYQYICEFSQLRFTEEFNKEMHECEVCAEAKQGENCVFFTPCLHTFCRQCTRDFFTMNINEGAAISCRCLHPNCDSEPSQQFVRSVVSTEVYQKYEEMLLKVALDSMADVVNCPGTGCDAPVLAEPDSTLARCHKCELAFCKLCRRTYHGVAPCELRSGKMAEVRRQYEQGDALTRSRLVRQYGEKMLNKIIAESRSEQWLSSNSKPCPTCGVHIEKTTGCNKMTCARCGTHWCWLCGVRLRKEDPYGHFNRPKTDCFQKLFEGVDREELMLDFPELDDDDGEGEEEWENLDQNGEDGIWFI